MPPLSESATIATDLFEHREVKAHFINPCCFGEDFAGWLRGRLQGLNGFTLGEPIMEDYGWGFWVNHPNGSIWIALGIVDDEPVEGPASWVVTCEWEETSLLKRWFGKPDAAVFRTVADAVWAALRSEPAIKFEGESVDQA